jgi:hypothetical protein
MSEPKVVSVEVKDTTGWFGEHEYEATVTTDTGKSVTYSNPGKTAAIEIASDRAKAKG